MSFEDLSRSNCHPSSSLVNAEIVHRHHPSRASIRVAGEVSWEVSHKNLEWLLTRHHGSSPKTDDSLALMSVILLLLEGQARRSNIQTASHWQTRPSVKKSCESGSPSSCALGLSSAELWLIEWFLAGDLYVDSMLIMTLFNTGKVTGSRALCRCLYCDLLFPRDLWIWQIRTDSWRVDL